MLYTIVASIGLPLVYGSYIDEIDKRKSIKVNLSVFKNAQRTITRHLKTKKNRPERTIVRVPLRKNKKLKPVTISKKIVIPKTSFKKMKKVTLKTTLISIKLEKNVTISNNQLVEHYGFKVEENKIDWIAHFKRHQIEEKLIALSRQEEKRKQKKVIRPLPILAKKVEEKIKAAPLTQKVKEKVLVQRKNNTRVDTAHHSMASTTTLTTHNKVSLQENDYPKTGPPLNTHPTISQVNKDILSPVVRQAIDRAYQQFDMNIQEEYSTDKLVNNQKKQNKQEKQTIQKNNPKKDLAVFIYPKEEEKQDVALSSPSSLDIHKMFSPDPVPPFKSFQQQNLVKVDIPKDNPETSKSLPAKINPIQAFPQITSEDVKKHQNNSSNATIINGQLTAYQAGGAENSLIYNLAFVPDYDPNASFHDYGDGEIRIEEKINGPMSILAGTLNASGMIRTRINWMLTLEDQKIHVPIFDESEFYDLLEQHNLTDEGAHLLVELNEAVEATELDSEYNAKLYLDQNFNESEDDIHFVLYIGVSPGNRLIKYRTFNDKISEKVVFLGDGEVFYDKIGIWRPGLEKIALFEKKLMGQYPSELVIDGDQIRYFNKDIKASIAGTNFYEYLRPQLPTGMRQYLQFTHLNGTIFSGHWHKKKLEIPGSSFIDEVYRMFDIENLHGRCFIQLNFSKKIMALKSQGITTKGPMDLQIMVLEKDGTVTSEITATAEKVFFLGDEQGMANIKIFYVDDSVDIFQSYCSSDSYLIEQL